MHLLARIVAIAGVLLLALPALAAPLDDAKRQGLVGERIDGFVGIVVADPTSQTRALVEQINAEREAKYAEIARQRGVPIAAVAQITGEKLIARAAPGEYVAGADGRWRQK